MAANIIESLREYEDDIGRRFLAFETRSNLLKRMMYEGIQIVSGTALATYTWKMDFHPISPFVFSTIGTAGVVGLCVNIRKYFWKSPNSQREGIGSKWYLTTGTITYFANVYAGSEFLKRDNAIWIACAGVAAFGYCLAVSSMNSLGRALLNRKPYLKCGQLMFGPTLIASAAYYLLNFRQHDEEFMFCLPWIAAAAAANHISFTGYQRFESNDEPNWMLFKGIELLLGGCIMCVSGAFLIVYTLEKEYHPLIIIFQFTIFLNGVSDIFKSLETFREYADLEEPAFNCICGMVVGPVIFVSTCLGIKYIQHTVMVPSFFVASGIGLALLGKSVVDLYHHFPRRVFSRFDHRVLGPIMIVWGSLTTTYIGYHLGWRSSLLVMPLIPVGMFATYRGFTNIDGPE